MLSRRGKGAEHAAPRPPPRPSHVLPHVLDRVAGPSGAWLRPPGLDRPGCFQAKIIAVTLFGQSLPVAPHQPRRGRRSVLLLSPWEPTLLPGPRGAWAGPERGAPRPCLPGHLVPPASVQGRSSGPSPWHRERGHRLPVVGMRTCVLPCRAGVQASAPPHTSPVLAVLLTWFPLAPSRLCDGRTDPTSQIGPPGWQRSCAVGARELDLRRPGTGPT